MSEQSAEQKTTHTFFDLASFGKRMEFALIAAMLKEDMDIYRPMVDDKGIDCVLRRGDGSYAEIQIKARSANIGAKHAARFAGIECVERRNYWFIFHSAKIGATGTMWIMNSLEFVKLASCSSPEKDKKKYTIDFHYVRKGKDGVLRAYPRANLEKYIATDFSRIRANTLFTEDISATGPDSSPA